ncbi:hypothetical protein AB4Z21_23450 [Paenibacillus sp. MCAF20]
MLSVAAGKLVLQSFTLPNMNESVNCKVIWNEVEQSYDAPKGVLTLHEPIIIQTGMSFRMEWDPINL